MRAGDRRSENLQDVKRRRRPKHTPAKMKQGQIGASAKARNSRDACSKELHNDQGNAQIIDTARRSGAAGTSIWNSNSLCDPTQSKLRVRSSKRVRGRRARIPRGHRVEVEGIGARSNASQKDLETRETRDCDVIVTNEA